MKSLALTVVAVLAADVAFLARRDGSAPSLAAAPSGLRTAGPLPAGAQESVEVFLRNPIALLEPSTPDPASFGDLRLAWVLAEFLRFHQAEPTGRAALGALTRLTGVGPTGEVPWVAYHELLLRWDVPAPPGYLDFKRLTYLLFDPRWAPFFDGVAELDWRLVTWGGVLRDGIRALDFPPPAPAEDVAAIADDEPVVGLVVNGEARAYLLPALASHELVNDRLGGADIAVTFCTLCQSAIAYDRNGGGTTVELGTSGLLYASNKLMFDRHTSSLFHQFTGEAVTGPLGQAQLRLQPMAATTTTWGAWRHAHPRTSVVTGERYHAYTPAPAPEEVERFPTGQVDRRLPARTLVFGVEASPGLFVAFAEGKARDALHAGRKVTTAGVAVQLIDGALVARSQETGLRLFGHSAFWFAWSRFHPGTLLWRG